MQLKLGDYELVFYNGGITIEKGGSYNTFGAYDIAGCDKLSMEEKQKRNRIYDEYIR